jgi:hypothetical protein
VTGRRRAAVWRQSPCEADRGAAPGSQPDLPATGRLLRREFTSEPAAAWATAPASGDAEALVSAHGNGPRRGLTGRPRDEENLGERTARKRSGVPSSGRCSKQDSRSQHLPSRTVPCSRALPQGQHAASPRKMDRSRERMLESGPPVRITRFVARIDLVTHAVAALSDRPGKACWQLRQSRRGLERLPTGLVGDRSLAKPGSKARRVRNCVRGLVPQIEPVTLAPVEVAKAPVRLLTG